MPPKKGSNGAKPRNGNGARNGNGNGRKNGNGGRRNGSKGNGGKGMQSNQNYRPYENNIERITGSELLTNITIKANPTTTKDRILVQTPVTPNQPVGTRIRRMANLWERYKFTKFTLRYVPAIPFTVGCQIMIMMDTDPNDDNAAVPDPDAFVRMAVSQASAQQFSFNKAKSINIALRKGKEMYYTGLVDTTNRQNARFNYQGTVYVIQLSKPYLQDLSPLTEDKVVGNLYLDWAMDVQTQQQNPEDLQVTPSASELELNTPEVIFEEGGENQLGTIMVEAPTWISTAALDFKAVAGLGTDIQFTVKNDAGVNHVLGGLHAPLGDYIDTDSHLVKLERGNYHLVAKTGFAGTLSADAKLKYVSMGSAPVFKLTPTTQ